MSKYIKPRTQIIIAMLIWGTLGLFVRGIELNSIEIAFFRASIGSLFLLIISVLNREKINKEALRKNLPILLVSGISLGINWATLFQAMKYTTIPNAILSYYMAPVFIIIFSFTILKEKINLKKSLCVLGALLGLFLVLKSGNNLELAHYDHGKGALYGLVGAILYGIIVTLNKKIKGLSPFQTTLSQLLIAALVLLPIIMGQGMADIKAANTKTWLLILIIGIVHTGFAYLLYFPSIKDVDSQSIATLSYLDPISSIVLAALFLNESMTLIQMLGGALILASAYISER